MAARQRAATLLCWFFAVFVALNQLLGGCVFACAPLGLLSASSQRVRRSRERLCGGGGACECLQVVGECAVSLLLAAGVVQYHALLVELALLVGHHVHHWFLRLIADVPDLSHAIRSSFTLKLLLCQLYLVFGYLGLSAQVALTVDLVYLCNLPTIFIYKLLARLYQLLLKYFWGVVELLSRPHAQWISCPYPPWMLRDSAKVLYIACLPVLACLMGVVGFYYIWLTFVIVVLKVVMNVGLNFCLCLEQLGFALCVVKGIPLAEAGTLSQEELIRVRLDSIEWVGIFEPAMFFQIFKASTRQTRSKEKSI